MHASWFFMWISIGVLAGSFAATISSGFDSYLWLIVALSLSLSSLLHKYRYLFVFALVAGMLLGLYRGSSEYVHLQDYQKYYGKEVVLTGRVVEDVSFGKKGDVRLRIGDVSIKGQHLPGVVWVSTSDTGVMKRGDLVTVRGSLLEGFGTMPASMFRAKILGITYPSHGDIGREARDWFAGGVEKAVPGEDAQFALAYLVGQKLTTPETLNDQLKTIGLIHAVVASGAHLTILVGAVRRLFIKVSKYLTAVMSFGMIGGFLLVTGFSPSMTRAGLVSGISLLAWYYGRVVHPMVLLPFVAAITVLYNPSYIWGDVGWYLSFAAFAGVIILAPLLHHYFWGADKSPGIFREVLIATIAAQVTTLPIVVAAFGYYSPYALLANILVVPLVPLTMLLTFAAGIIGVVMPSLAFLIGLPLDAILEYMKLVIDWLATAPGAKKELEIGWQVVAAAYTAIMFLMIYLWKVTGHSFRKNSNLQRDF